jgi:mRNA interferase YafQ
MTKPETLTVTTTAQYRKDWKRVNKRGFDMDELDDILKKLADHEQLDPALRDHALTGNYKGYRECHIQPDWLLVYRIVEDELVLVAFRTGSHSDLF